MTTNGWLRPLLGSMLAFAALVRAPDAAAQETGAADAGESPAAEETIEWNFRRVPVTSPRADVSLQERWETPFAVMSSGRPPRREARRVVMPGAAEVARRTAAVAADSGQTVARVRVDGGENRTLVAQGSAENAVDASEAAAGEEEEEADAAATADEEVDADEADEAAADEDGGAREPDEAVAEDDDAGDAGAAPRTHTVSRGDTLFGIARRYGVSANALRAANRLPNDVVRLGQTLVIPREETTR